MNLNIIEQEKFVDIGQKDFQTAQLKFYRSIDECFKNNSINVVLLSSVLPYLPEPYSVLKQVMTKDVEYILIDRTPVIASKNDRLTIQKVPKTICKASYPAWFFSEDQLKSVLTEKYDIIMDFPSLADSFIIRKPRAIVFDKFFLYRINSNSN